jgi:hypothetical protein
VLLLLTKPAIIAPHRTDPKAEKTQDGRKLRRYKRRWKIERLFAWVQNFRRLVVRYEYKDENFLGMAQLGCIIVLLTADFSVIDPYRLMRIDGSAEKPTRPIVHAGSVRININATRCQKMFMRWLGSVDILR